MAQKHLQLLRNGSAYENYQAAYQALSGMASYADGTPILARYSGGTGEIKTLLGVVNKASGVTTARVDIINDVQDAILRNYSNDDATISGAIGANDSIKVAFNKLENKIADTSVDVVRDETDDNTKAHLTVTPEDTPSGDTFTLKLIDVASASALTAETSARVTADTELSNRLGDGVTTANTATAQLTALSGNSSSVSGDTSVEGAKRYADEKTRASLDALDYNLASGASAAVVHINQTDGAVSAASVNVDTLLISDYAEGSDAKLANTDSIAAAFGKVQGQINAMDLSVVSGAGEVITAVSEADGKVSAEKTAIKDVTLTGYVKDTTKTGALAATDDIENALSKIENNIEAAKQATTVASADNSINVTPSTGGTDINVNIKSGEKVLKKDGKAGLYTDIKLKKVTESLPAEVKERYLLVGDQDSQLGTVTIDVPKDSHIVSINYITTGEHAQNLEYVYIDASGNTQTTYVDMSELVLENEFASGVTVTDHVAHGVVDPTSETFLTVGAGGFKLSGVQDAIDDAIEALDVTDDAAVAGQYVAAIQEADGIVSVKTRANVSEAVLNNYAKGSDATAVAATDTVNQAISKLENQVDKAKAAATTKVVEGTDAGNNMTIVPTTGADESVTYTVNLTDVASASALTDEISYRKAVDGVNGDAYTADTNAHYISGAINLYTADQALDTALYNESTARTAAIQELDAEESGATDHVSVKVTEVDGVITDVTVTETNIASESELYGLSAKTFTAAAMTGGTVSTATTANGTVQLNINTNGSQVLLTGYEQGSESGAPVSGDSVNAAIAKLYNRTLATEVMAGSATTVSQASTGTTVDVKLDTTSTIAEYDETHAKAVNDKSKNVLEITANGLYLNNNWDCGTY